MIQAIYSDNFLGFIVKMLMLVASSNNAYLRSKKMCLITKEKIFILTPTVTLFGAAVRVTDM
jgi:hypothetical protein